MNITDRPTPETDALSKGVVLVKEALDHARRLEQRLGAAVAALEVFLVKAQVFGLCGATNHPAVKCEVRGLTLGDFHNLHATLAAIKRRQAMKIHVSKEWSESRIDHDENCEIGAGIPMTNDLTTLIQNYRAKLLAELAICEAATAGQWTQGQIQRTCVVKGGDGWGMKVVDNIEMSDATFIATARTALPDRIRENLRMLDALSMIYEQSCPDCGAYAYAESALRDILRPKEG